MTATIAKRRRKNAPTCPDVPQVEAISVSTPENAPTNDCGVPGGNGQETAPVADLVPIEPIAVPAPESATDANVGVPGGNDAAQANINELDPTSPANNQPKENEMPEKKKRKTTKAKKTEAAPAEAAPKAKKTKAAPAKESGMSALDAAAKVLAEEKKPMNVKELIAAMAAKDYWTSPGGKTPEATLAAAIGTEINKKGDSSRFARPEPGKFTLR